MTIGHRLTVLTGATLMALSVGACGGKVPPEVVQSADFQSGYADGCATGNRRTSRGFPEEVTRNDVLFRSNENYAIGWRQGYSICGGSQEGHVDRDIEFLATDRFDQGPI